MDTKRRTVDRLRAVNDLAVMIDKNQIADTHVSETFCKWVDPEVIGELRVAHRDVARKAFTKAQSTENSHCAGEFFEK